MINLSVAKPTPPERIVTRRSASGGVVMQLVRTNGHSATAEFDTHPQAFAHIDWLRSHLDSRAAPQRGPAASYVPFSEVAR